MNKQTLLLEKLRIVTHYPHNEYYKKTYDSYLQKLDDGVKNLTLLKEMDYYEERLPSILENISTNVNTIKEYEALFSSLADRVFKIKGPEKPHPRSIFDKENTLTDAARTIDKLSAFCSELVIKIQENPIILSHNNINTLLNDGFQETYNSILERVVQIEKIKDNNHIPDVYYNRFSNFMKNFNNIMHSELYTFENFVESV